MTEHNLKRVAKTVKQAEFAMDAIIRIFDVAQVQQNKAIIDIVIELNHKIKEL